MPTLGHCESSHDTAGIRQGRIQIHSDAHPTAHGGGGFGLMESFRKLGTLGAWQDALFLH